MSISDYKPEIWRTTTKEGDRFFLVCRHRWLRGQEVKGNHKDPFEIRVTPRASDQRKDVPDKPHEWEGQFDFIAHSIAILLTENGWHLHQIHDNKSRWEAMPVTAFPHFPITKRTAAAALKIAWRTVNASVSLGDLSVKVKYNLSKLEVKGRSGHWKITAALSWEQWERDRLSLADRAAWLRGAGFPKVTETSLRKMAETYAL